ncbi:MAG: hypothetical protein LV481_01450 [Methylacidiphilales bacterium]|nr:hypothetical protein [Candidatus Methylacidiphilales bacterium]
MAGALLLIYSSTLAMQGRPKLAAFLLLVGLALIVAGVIIILVANL